MSLRLNRSFHGADQDRVLYHRNHHASRGKVHHNFFRRCAGIFLRESERSEASLAPNTRNAIGKQAFPALDITVRGQP